MCVVVATPNLDTVSQRNCRQEPDTRMTVMCRRFSCSSSNIDVERAALQALRGVQLTVAVTMVAEIGDLSRFDTPRELMKFLGLTPSEYSSGDRRQQGSI